MGDPNPDRVDVLVYATPGDGATHRAIETGRGAVVADAHRDELRKRRALRRLLLGTVCAIASGYALLVERYLLSALAVAVVVGASVAFGGEDDGVPTVVEQDVRRERAEREYDVE